MHKRMNLNTIENTGKWEGTVYIRKKRRQEPFLQKSPLNVPLNKITHTALPARQTNPASTRLPFSLDGLSFVMKFHTRVIHRDKHISWSIFRTFVSTN